MTPGSCNQGNPPFTQSQQDPPSPSLSSAQPNQTAGLPCTPGAPTNAKESPPHLPKPNDLQGSTPPTSATDHVARIMRGVLQPGSSFPNDPVESLKSPPANKPLIMSNKAKSTREGEPRTPRLHYNKLTASKRQEINEKASAFYDSLSKYAESNGLNPVDVTRQALGGKLKGVRMNCWKSFQALSGMARTGRKLIQVLLISGSLNEILVSCCLG
jgi:hypothetical protein